jgi:hypothetical protein
VNAPSTSQSGTQSAGQPIVVSSSWLIFEGSMAS